MNNRPLVKTMVIIFLVFVLTVVAALGTIYALSSFRTVKLGINTYWIKGKTPHEVSERYIVVNEERDENGVILRQTLQRSYWYMVRGVRGLISGMGENDVENESFSFMVVTYNNGRAVNARTEHGYTPNEGWLVHNDRNVAKTNENLPKISTELAESVQVGMPLEEVLKLLGKGRHRDIYENGLYNMLEYPLESGDTMNLFFKAISYEDRTEVFVEDIYMDNIVRSYEYARKKLLE